MNQIGAVAPINSQEGGDGDEDITAIMLDVATCHQGDMEAMVDKGATVLVADIGGVMAAAGEGDTPKREVCLHSTTRDNMMGNKRMDGGEWTTRKQRKRES